MNKIILDLKNLRQSSRALLRHCQVNRRSKSRRQAMIHLALSRTSYSTNLPTSKIVVGFIRYSTLAYFNAGWQEFLMVAYIRRS